MVDTTKFINPAQVGGIESYLIDDGDGRGVRALCVNTGGGLRYRILVDRGLDIDHAFYNQHSLAFLTHGGVTAPTRALDRGLDWLKGFPGGLLVCCGPFYVGGPHRDGGAELGLHGPHSNTAGRIISIAQPQPHRGRNEMSFTGLVRYGAFYGPCVELRRTITSALGENYIDFTDEFYNAGNTAVPHAWLLHINFGYPLIDAGSEFCLNAPRVEPWEQPASQEYFKVEANHRRVPAALDEHAGEESVGGYLFPRATGENGRTRVGVANRKLGLAVAIDYSTKEFGRCGVWRHYGRGEYVAALEPMNGTLDGPEKDRARGLQDSLKPGATKTYKYRITALSKPEEIDTLLKL